MHMTTKKNYLLSDLISQQSLKGSEPVSAFFLFSFNMVETQILNAQGLKIGDIIIKIII